MSLRIAWRFYNNSQEPITPTSVTLADPNDVYGVRRTDTGAVVVAVGTDMTEIGNNIWQYQFEEPEPGLNYEYYVRVEEEYPVHNIYFINGHVEGSRSSIIPHTLGWCRKMLVDITGRFDLVVDAGGGDYTDNGLANWYLNAAQQRLDNMLPNKKSTAWLYKELDADESMITFTQCRFVKNVYEQDEDGERTAVTWSALNIGLAPEQREALEEDDPEQEDELVIDWTKDIMFGEHYWHHAIYVPPETESRQLVIEAAWYSRHLTDDLDRSFWTTQHPHLLVRAAQRELEVDMRNTQGVKDFDEPLAAAVRDIYLNLVEEEMAGDSSLWIRPG